MNIYRPCLYAEYYLFFVESYLKLTNFKSKVVSLSLSSNAYGLGFSKLWNISFIVVIRFKFSLRFRINGAGIRIINAQLAMYDLVLYSILFFC